MSENEFHPKRVDKTVSDEGGVATYFLQNNDDRTQVMLSVMSDGPMSSENYLKALQTFIDDVVAIGADVFDLPDIPDDVLNQ